MVKSRSDKIAHHRQLFAKRSEVPYRYLLTHRTVLEGEKRLGKKLPMPYCIAMHTVTVLALDGVLAFDLSTPVEVFGRARLPDGRRAYVVRVCAPAEEVDANLFVLRVPWGLDALAGADTIIVPGLADPMVPISEDVLGALRRALEGGSRIASICVGAFTLAAAGLLDGLRATTHWAAAGELSRLYPDIEVDDGVLFVDNGQVLTSAGAAASLDLCLHMIRRDHGSAVAADAARLAVMPLERDGGRPSSSCRSTQARTAPASNRSCDGCRRTFTGTLPSMISPPGQNSAPARSTGVSGSRPVLHRCGGYDGPESAGRSTCWRPRPIPSSASHARSASIPRPASAASSRRWSAPAPRHTGAPSRHPTRPSTEMPKR